MLKNGEGSPTGLRSGKGRLVVDGAEKEKKGSRRITEEGK